MFKKGSVFSLALLATSINFSYLNGEDVHKKEPTMIRKDLEKALSLLAKPKRSLTSSSVINPLLENAQSLIKNRLNKMKEAAPVSSSTSINDELLYIGSIVNDLQSPTQSYCQSILNNAQAAIQTATSEEAKSALLETAWQSIGPAIYLDEFYPQEMNTWIDPASLENTQTNLQAQIQQEMQSYLSYFNSASQLYQKSGLEDPALALSFLQPQIIANILLTASGKLNLGMIPFIRNTFIPKESPLEYQTGIDRVLLSMNSSWQADLDNIVKPENPASIEIVLADLGLKRSTELSDFHSKWAALKALLSQLNQGAVGDCFAVAWSIKKHNEYFLQSLKDYGELLKSGYLTRTVNGVPDRFYFENTLADTDLSNPVTITAAGAMANGAMLWEAPGLVSACRQMGIDDMKSCALSAIQPLFSNGAKSTQTTPEAIIASFASYAAANNSRFTKDQAFQLGKYGFSQTQNHLLRAWETTFASMAEAKKGDYMRDQVNQSVQDALKDQWANWTASLPENSQPLGVELQNNFAAMLDQENRFIYDSAIPLKQVSSDGSSTDGGFELFRRLPNDPLAMGERVATPDQFRSYLIDVANLSVANTPVSSADDQAALGSLAKNLISYMQGNEFLTNVFYAYDDANKKVADPIANYQSLNSTPMTTLQGDNPFEVEAVDTGLSFQPDAKTVNPQNPYDLVKWILDLAQWKESTQHYMEEGNSAELDPATSPQHAFNIAFDDADIENFVLSKKTSDDWLQETVIQPSLAVGQTTIDAATKTAFSNNFLGWLERNAQLSEGAVRIFQSQINAINQKQMSVQLYCSTFLKMITNSFRLNAAANNQLSLAFDTIFLQSLPATLLQGLSQNALRFAKTNWDDSDKNIYFCTFVNPRTGALSFGSIDEDRTHLSLMDEHEWVDQQTWEIVPEDEPASIQ